jgi:D-methionine transport system ATP-binding protein
MQVVKEICNKVAVMDKGQVIEAGTAVDIFSAPREALTRDFIRTATHVDQAEASIFENSPGVSIYELKFSGESSSAPVIIELFKRFGLTASILYGNIEYIQNIPLGTLLVSFDKTVDFGQISEYLNGQNVKIRLVERAEVEESEAANV